MKQKIPYKTHFVISLILVLIGILASLVEVFIGSIKTYYSYNLLYILYVIARSLGGVCFQIGCVVMIYWVYRACSSYTDKKLANCNPCSCRSPEKENNDTAVNNLWASAAQQAEGFQTLYPQSPEQTQAKRSAPSWTPIDS